MTMAVAPGRDTCPHSCHINSPTHEDTHNSNTSSSAANTSSSSLSTATTPGKDDSPGKSRRNKRKMTEPRRRTADFSIKRLCPDNPDENPDSMAGLPADSSPHIHAAVSGSVHNLPDTPPSSSSSDKANSSTDASPSPGLLPPKTTAPSTPLFYPVVPNPLYAPPGVLPLMVMPPPGFQLGPFLPQPPGPTQQLGGTPTTRPHTPAPSPSSSVSSDPGADMDPAGGSAGDGRSRKNYKNMTRERRVEANARERSRVHTISAAFDSLRRAVPSYSYNQRLSKLAILRIACNYIMALGRLADLDYSKDDNGPSFAECVDMCTNTIQTEGRAKRRH